ncbi:HAD-like domain-containing protein [Catenaria anguillulae PL171]|uniref:Mitochondrial import inner membrane translocase subunit TIM50 n=1 Tax=Catenaria anguillulae PL171 TaxID=765915 RepID=A0A1Y2I4H9_9FUNG|nr:HAD-like domain-containing protein [Catenaria anguillulae PL171]
MSAALARPTPSVSSSVTSAVAASSATLFARHLHLQPARFNTSKPTDKYSKLSEGIAAQTLLGKIETAKVAAEDARNAEGSPAAAAASSSTSTADPFADPASPDRARKPSSSSSSSLDEDLPPGQKYTVIFMFTTLFGAGIWAFGAPDEADGSMSPVAIAKRIKRRFSEWTDSFTAPTYDKLLPDPLPAGYQKDYTLVINLTDTMIHPTWDAQHGWRVSKRPDLDYFLGYLSRFYEIVVFTRMPGFSAQPLIDRIDTYQSITYRLYKDATTYKDGEYIKDLSKLNRDLSRVIVMDWDELAFKQQPDNAIKLERWDGSPNVRSLKDYIPFLEMIALKGVPDVRPILKSYAGADVPTKFAERQIEYRKHLAEEMRRAESESSAKQSASASGGGVSAGLRGLLGATSSRIALQHQQQQQLELQRHAQMYQKQFEEEAQMIKEEVERARKAQEDEIQKQMQKMKKKMTLLQFVNQMMDPEFQRMQQEELQAALNQATLSATTAGSVQ